MVTIRRVRVNFELRFNFEKLLHEFIKSLPKDQQ
ncbi:unnamed protein product, partial [marine sediment metagenome]